MFPTFWLSTNTFLEREEGGMGVEEIQKRQSKTTRHVFCHFPKENQEKVDVLRLSLTQIPRFCTKKLFFCFFFCCSFSYTVLFYLKFASLYLTKQRNRRGSKRDLKGVHFVGCPLPIVLQKLQEKLANLLSPF